MVARAFLPGSVLERPAGKLNRVSDLRSAKTKKPIPKDSIDEAGSNYRTLIDDPMFADLNLENVRVLERSEHSISRKKIAPNALKILYKLDSAGFQGFLVGGCVRDLMIGIEPKDFDIATDATPEQIRSLFRNARIIGRRFKIVHIRFGREIYEVTTFRAQHDPEQLPTPPSGGNRRALAGVESARSSTGMILRDNVYGDINDDAVRRDFSINSLYYTIRNYLVLDFCDGLTDIEKRQIRIIGDPIQRYTEDPVRMLRAIRFAAKLQFSIDRETEDAIEELAQSMESVSSARLFDEIVKLYSTGHGERTHALLLRSKLRHYILPDTFRSLENRDDPSCELIALALRNTDNRLAENKSVTPAFLYAALLWPVLIEALGKPISNSNIQELRIAASEIISRQNSITAMPRRISMPLREIWELQIKLTRRNKRSAISAFEHPRFRAAYDFLLLREEAGEDLKEVASWWTDLQLVDADQQASMFFALNPRQGRRRRRRRGSTANK